MDGYLYNDGLPLDEQGRSLRYPEMRPYDCCVPTLADLKLRVERDIGYVPEWLATLDDPTEYVQVEEEVVGGEGETHYYTGRVISIEGCERDKAEVTTKQAEALVRRIPNGKPVTISLTMKPFDLPEGYILVSYRDGELPPFVCGISRNGEVSS